MHRVLCASLTTNTSCLILPTMLQIIPLQLLYHMLCVSLRPACTRRVLKPLHEAEKLEEWKTDEFPADPTAAITPVSVWLEFSFFSNLLSVIQKGIVRVAAPFFTQFEGKKENKAARLPFCTHLMLIKQQDSRDRQSIACPAI